jgi:hypothetical protein
MPIMRQPNGLWTLFTNNQEEEMADDSYREDKEFDWNPLLIAAAAVGAAVLAGGVYRYFNPKQRRPKWKSKSRRPQISRLESQGGDVPEVMPLQVSRTQH